MGDLETPQVSIFIRKKQMFQHRPAILNFETKWIRNQRPQ